MRMINLSGSTYSTDEFDHLSVAPNGVVEIHDGYCRPGVYPNGSRRPSLIERMAPCLVPENLEQRATWGKDTPSLTPRKLAPTPEQVVAALVEQGTAPAVAALIQAGAVETSGRKGK